VDADWLEFHPDPSTPEYQPPAGAVDAHCHVFGPVARFPFALERKYTPCDAGIEALWALRDHLGFSRNVIVQATCHGADNRALLDALQRSGDLARGVATVTSDVTDEYLQELHGAGVRGVRFNFVRRLVDKLPYADLQQVADRVAPLGWHAVIYFEAADLDSIDELILSLPTPVVIDHMGRPDVSKQVAGREFQRFVALLSEREDIFTKVSCPERLSKVGPDGYEDVVPFAQYLVQHFPEQVLWGTDWPHPNMKSHMPDDGKLVDIIPLIAPSEALQKSLLITNPMRLYWPGLDRL
jgi:2-pyrone-4,6-dicarboxylate lactonase